MNRRRKTLLVVGSVGLALVVLVGLFTLSRMGTGRMPAAGVDTSTPSLSTPTFPPSSPASSATPEATPATTPPSATPSTRPATGEHTAYCRAYARITASGAQGTNGTDDGGVDLAALSKTYAQLLGKYEAAAAVAPSELSTAYADVVRYLKEAKATADSRDFEAVRAQLRLLGKLNESMARIDSVSRSICG